MPSATKSLHKVSRILIYEDVLSILRAAMLDGSFEIGERLVETEIAEQLKTSRVPVAVREQEHFWSIGAKLRV